MMCVVNSTKDKFEVIILSKDGHVICPIHFASISLVCRFLTDFEFDYGDCEIIRLEDMQKYDPQLLLSIFRGE